MVVNYEFLDSEPMDNLVTCLNFKVDKAVYLGYHDPILEQGKNIKKFLEKYCDVKEVVFLEVPKHDLQSILNTLRTEVAKEKKKKNQVFFDVTGGEHLVLVAFGMLSMETETPMHMFNVKKNRLIELDEGAKASIGRDAERRQVPLTLDMVIEMHGGTINKKLQKDIKNTENPEFVADVEKIYKVASKYWNLWNPFSDLLTKTMTPSSASSLKVNKNRLFIERILKASGTKLTKLSKLNEIMDDLFLNGIITGYQRSGDTYQFSYKNEAIRQCLWDGGSILELHTCITEQPLNDECRVGVHLDWDGVIQQSGGDLMNEIDVLTLKGNIPTFISCKSGKMGYQQILHALYELDTISKRFGGKYCKKILVTVNPLSEVYLERAKEMGIEVRTELPEKAQGQ